jgi:hypothetical protein
MKKKRTVAEKLAVAKRADRAMSTLVSALDDLIAAKRSGKTQQEAIADMRRKVADLASKFSKAKKETNPALTCPRNVALLGLVTLIEYKAGGKSHVLKFPGRHQKQTAKKQFCLMLGEPKKRAMFASAKQRLLGHADPARSTAPARSLLKSWASYAASNVLKLEVADLKCATLIGEVVAIEYESQKWSGTTWTLYRHEFDRPADLYRSKSGGLYGIVRRDQKTIVTPRGIVG